MMDETKLNDLVEIFRELAELSGGYEETKIYTNLEVINASPANLPAGYIIIKDSEDYHIPALKVAGLTYANGDLVNVLFIKGTEPIAFQQGSGSSAVGYALSISDEGVDQGNASTLDFVGAGVTAAVAAGIATITVASSGGWPFTNVLTVSSTDPDADYPDIPSAITAAAASGDNIELDPDTYTAPNVAGGITIDESLSIVGKSPQETVITRADNSSVTVTIADTPVTLRNLTLAHTGAGAGTSTPLSNDQASLVLDNCYLLKSGASGNSIGFSQGGGDSLLRNCKISATNGTILNYAVYLHTAASTCVLDGGEVLAGALAAGHASAVIELRGVRLASGVTLDVSGGGTIKGWYVNSAGQVIRLGMSVAVYHSATQTISDTTNTALAFDSERWDDAGYHSTVTNNSRLTIPTGYGGVIFRGTFNVRYAANSTGVRDAAIRLNGSTFIAYNRMPAAASPSTTVVSCPFEYVLNDGDYIEAICQQTSGGNLDVVPAGNFTPEFRMSRL